MTKQPEEIPEGYRNTKVGIIPQKWNVKTLSKIAHIERGRFSPRPRNDPRFYGGEIPFVQTSDVSQSAGVVQSHSQTLNEEGLKVSKLFPTGTILITIASNIGHSAILKYAMACPDSLIGISVNKDFSGEFLNYYFIQNQKRLEYDAPGAQKNINIEFLKSYHVIVPPLPEQKKIAEILGTWDEAIAKTQELIAQLKKRNKGLAQQLLTGKKRLPEFSGEWENVKISAIAKEVKLLNKEGLELEVLSCTKYDGLVRSLEYFGRQVFGNDLSKYKIVPEGCFAYATNHIEEGSIGYQDLLQKALISPMYTVFRTKDFIDDAFLFRLLKTDRMIYNYQSNMSGSINRRGGLRWKDFSAIHIGIPTFKEQTAIASVLEEADRELKLTEQKLTTLKTQKKGLMQKLLTGEVRVKLNSV